MPKALKVFRAHLGFFETIMAAQEEKAAAAAAGSDASIFQHKTAVQTEDKVALEAARERAGIVLIRPFGSHGAFKEKPDVPKVPKLTSAQKRASAEHKQRDAAEKRAKRKEQDKAAEKEQREELKELDRQEKELKRRRAVLNKAGQH